MLAYLVELGPLRVATPVDPARQALARVVARRFAPRRTERLAPAPSLRELARRRPGLIRFSGPADSDAIS